MLKLALVALALFVQKPQTPARPESTQPDGQRPATQLEEFLSKKGTLIVRDIFSAEVLPGDSCFLAVDAVSAYQPGHESTKVKGLQCSIHRVSGSFTNSRGCSLDLEEAESVSGALQYLIDLADKWKGLELGKYEERQATFYTSDDLRIRIAISHLHNEVQLSVRIGTISTESIEFDSPEKIRTMKTSVDKAIAWLKTQ